MKIKYQKINKRTDFKKPEVDPLTGGLLIRSTWNGRVAGHTTAVIKSGVAIEVPEGYYGMVVDTKNLIENYKLSNKHQTITSHDREELSLYLTNYSPYPEPVEYNQVIAMVVFLPINEIELKGVAKLSKVKTEE